MTRLGLTSLALVLGLASAVTVVQAQGVQDPNRSRLNDPANARNLNDTQDPKNSRLNDPANARNANDKDNKRDTTTPPK